MTQEERIQLYEMLLRRAAFSLQDYAAETMDNWIVDSPTTVNDRMHCGSTRTSGRD